jgi:hypothetical protein
MVDLYLFPVKHIAAAGIVDLGKGVEGQDEQQQGEWRCRFGIEAVVVPL